MAEATVATRAAGSGESFAMSDASGAADREPADRGTLHVKSRALTRIAEHAADEVEGTVRSGSTVQKTLGRGYPRASVRLDGHRAWIDLDVAVTWPAPTAAVAQRVRDSVITRATRLSGLDVRRVDVTVHVITETGDAEPRRRVE